MKKNMLFSAVFTICLTFTGCTTPSYQLTQYQNIPMATPINVSDKNLPLIGVSEITSLAAPDSVIGAHYSGLLHLKQYSHRTAGKIADESKKHYKAVMISELENAGYSVVGASMDLFDNDDLWKARYMISGTRQKRILNTYGNVSETKITIDWKIFDKQTKKIIYTQSTFGYAKIKDTTSEASSLAIKKAFRKLLSSPSFIKALESQKQDSKTSTETSKPVYYYEAVAQDQTDFDIEKIKDAVITIKCNNGHGSGFIINEKGYAITNNHVVANQHTIEVLLKGGKPIGAKVIKTLPEKDLALIKIQGSAYDYLPLEKNENIKVGQEVYAVGAPHAISLSHSVSKGIISGIRKTEDPEKTFIQTDTAVNGGNSGGALVNKKGNVVGVVVSKVAEIGVSGLNFAISIEDAKKHLNLEKK